MADNPITEAKTALAALAGAWRGDWADFDGRTLRDQLGEIARILDGTSDAQVFAEINAICLRCRCWTEHCDGHKDESDAK